MREDEVEVDEIEIAKIETAKYKVYDFSLRAKYRPPERPPRQKFYATIDCFLSINASIDNSYKTYSLALGL